MLNLVKKQVLNSRYVSLKSNDANIRVGPSINYPIVIKFIQHNYPLKILEEYDDWRKLKILLRIMDGYIKV